MSEENKSSSPACGMSLGEAASKASQEWCGPLTQNHDPAYWKSIREVYACGFMRGFNDCDSRKRVSDREPDALQTAGTKHVGISDLLAGERVSGKDFVFLDHAYRPYRVRDVAGTLWLHYWHADKKWVTKRTVSDDEAARWIETALKPAMAKLYEGGVPLLAS